MVTSNAATVRWVLLNYRVPREPSSPRIAVWRRLRRLGVAQLGDGLVALPEDARTREQLEWVADLIDDAGGTATLWRAEAMSRADERRVARAMAEARAAEYFAIAQAADAAMSAADGERVRDLRRLRRELRAVQRRDYFPPDERERARLAVEALAVADSHDRSAGLEARR